MSESPYATPNADLEIDPSEATPSDLKSLMFSFQGRVPRRTFWAVSLGMTAVFVAVIFGGMLIFGEESAFFGAIVLVLYIPVIWVSLAIQSKRWHDRGKSAWWLLIGFIPVIGAIWAFVETGCLRGSEGSNQFGPDPT